MADRPSIQVNGYGKQAARQRVELLRQSARELRLAEDLAQGKDTRMVRLLERGWLTAEDAVKQLVILNADHHRFAVKALQAMAGENRSMFDVAREGRDRGLEPTLLQELLRRGQELAVEARRSRLHAATVVAKSAPPGGGWQPIPKGKHGGYRKPKSGGGYTYIYPDGKGGWTNTEHPHAGEHADVHAEHEVSTPSPEIATRFAKLQERAKALGVTLSAQATSKTTPKHLEQLEHRLDLVEKDKAKKGKKGKAKPAGAAPEAGKDGAGAAPEKAPEGGVGGEHVTASFVDGPDAEVTDEHRDAMVGKIREAAKARGLDGDDLERLEAIVADAGNSRGELETVYQYVADDDNWEPKDEESGLPGNSPLLDLPDEEPPKDPHAVAHLQAQVKGLQEALIRMEGHLDAQHKKLHAMLQKEAKYVHDNPTHTGVAWLKERVKAFALLSLGFGAGMVLGGPLMGLMGMTAMDKLLHLDAAHRRAQGAPAREQITEPQPPMPTTETVQPAPRAAEPEKVEPGGDNLRDKVRKPTLRDRLRPSRNAGATKDQQAAAGDRLTRLMGKSFGIVARDRELVLVLPAVQPLLKGFRLEPELAKNMMASAHPPPGFAPAPRSRIGAFRKRNGSGGWDYWLPGKGVAQPAAKPKPGPTVLSPQELDHLLKHGTYSIISAGRNPNHPDEAKLPVDHPSFAERHQKLKDDLTRRGYTFTEVEGNYDGKEPSLVVFHDDRKINAAKASFMVQHGNQPSDYSAIRDLGRAYNQDSVVHSHHGTHELHFTVGEHAGEHYKGHGHKIVPDASNYYTEAKTADGKATRFTLDFDWGSLHKFGEAVLKSVEPPAIRGRHPTNQWGHRDGLNPGDRLAVHAGPTRDVDPEVVVLDGGEFSWNGAVFANGNQLLKALTGRNDHRLTVRRYFRLDPRDAQIAKAAASELRQRFPGITASAYRGSVRVEGDLGPLGLTGSSATLDYMHAIELARGA